MSAHHPHSTWTEARENLLRVLWTQGLSASQIAIQLGGGITRNAVIGKRLRLGLPDRAMPNRTYGRQNSKSRKQIVQAARQLLPKQPKFKPEPISKPRTPEKGPNAVRFIDRQPWQCPMFCAGEEGAQGFVCGEATGPESVWCPSCRRIAFQPLRQKEAA